MGGRGRTLTTRCNTMQHAATHYDRQTKYDPHVGFERQVDRNSIGLRAAGPWPPLSVRCSVLQCVAVCCSVLQCVAVCCSVLQCEYHLHLGSEGRVVEELVHGCTRQDPGNTLQHATTRCNTLQHTTQIPSTSGLRKASRRGARTWVDAAGP